MASTARPFSLVLLTAIFTVSVTLADSLPSFTASSLPSTDTVTAPLGTGPLVASSSLRLMVSKPEMVRRSSSGVTVMVVSLPVAVVASEAFT